jgi:peroxiredoxin
MATAKTLAARRARRRRHTRSRNLKAALFVGGLLIISAFLLLSKPTETPSTELPGFSSVIPAEVDFPAPELALNRLGQGVESLADYQGQVVLVNNWAIWCPPCKAEMPHLDRYYQDHRAEGFTIIGIEAGSPSTPVAAFADDLGVSFPIWLDPDKAAIEAFRNGSLPNSYVIDRSGQVRLAWTGPISSEILEQTVTPLIQAAP